MTDQFTASDLCALIRDPRRVEEVPREMVPTMLAGLAGLQALLQLRLHQPAAPALAPPAKLDSGRLLTAKEAATRLAVDRRWLYRNADSLPFTRRLSSRALRFDEAGLQRWADRQRP